jgi:hypothetical protein
MDYPMVFIIRASLIFLLAATQLVFAADQTSTQCATWQSQFNLIPYKSWGSTPQDIQKAWETMDCNHKICQYFKDKYGVTPYQSWGNLPPDLQAIWDTPQVDCNHHLDGSSIAAAGSDVVTHCTQLADTYGIVPATTWGSAPADIQQNWDALDCNHQMCQVYKNKYGISPYRSWGSMPQNLQTVWDLPQMDCNHHVS